MKCKYIRVLFFGNEDILDVSNWEYEDGNYNTDKYTIYENEIIAQADNIEDLIRPGDLVRYNGLYMSWIEKDRGEEIRGIDMVLIPRKDVCDLWIPIGEDPECHPHFKLVASKGYGEEKLKLI